jgi:hypothetical protein
MQRDAYLYIFDSFAATTAEVANHLHITPQHAYRLLGTMAGILLSDEMQDTPDGPHATRSDQRLPGQNILWPCFYTYDSESREEAGARFDRWAAERNS